jgi:hemerythrin-like domain-containing protein
MDVFEVLQSEHRVIRRALDALEVYVEAVERGEPVDRADLGRFVSFFRDFVDLCHCDKEEHVFLPLLVEHGLDWGDSALSSVFDDHKHERYLVRVLADAASQEKDFNLTTRQHVVRVARQFVAFQRAHIALEEDRLFPEARRRLEPKAVEAIGLAFERFRARHLDKAEEEANHHLHALVDRYSGQGH